MVKTKIIAKKKVPVKEKQGAKRGDKKIIEANLFEAKALKKGEYRTRDEPFGGMGEDEPEHKRQLDQGLNNGWWDSMQDGETCRTYDDKKVHIAVSMSINTGKGINIQGYQDGKYYVWYMTRIMTKRETEKPEKKIASKGKRK